MSDLTGRFCYSEDGEKYTGDFGSIDEIKAELGDDFNSVEIGQYQERVTVMMDGDNLVEMIDDYCVDNSEACLEDSIFEHCDGSRKELARRLEQVVEQFFEEYPIKWYRVKTLRRVE